MDDTSIGVAVTEDRAEILALCVKVTRSQRFVQLAGGDAGSRELALWRWRLESLAAGGAGLLALVARDWGGGPVRGVVAGVALPTTIQGTLRESLRVVVAGVAGPFGGPSEQAKRGRELLRRLGRAWRRRLLDRVERPVSLSLPATPERGPAPSELLGFGRLGTIELTEHSRLDVLSWKGRDFLCAELQRPPKDADRLWRRVSAGMTFGVARTASYLRWRYLQHPWRSYVLVGVRARAGGDTRGLAVLARVPGAHDAFAAVEWIVPEKDDAATEALAGACARFVSSRRGSILATMQPATYSRRRFMGDLGFTPRRIDVTRFGMSGSEALSPARLRREGYVSLGDSEQF